MATYDELMVYKHAYDLCTRMMEVSKKMDRGYKYTLGEKMNNACVEMLICVYRINVSNAKEATFTNAREQIEVVRLLLRLFKDLKLITINCFSEMSEYVESVSRQLAGWQKSTRIALEKRNSDDVPVYGYSPKYKAIKNQEEVKRKLQSEPVINQAAIF